MPSKKPPAPSKSSRGANKPAANTSRPTTSKPPKSSSQDTPAQKAEKSEDEEEIRRQQTLLDIFSTTFREVLDAEDFAAQLQEVKAALFNRDFEAAFAREAALDVYAARWSPTRALCYGRVLRGLELHLQGLLSDSPEAGAGAGVQERGAERGAEISLARDESATLESDTCDAEPGTQEESTGTTERGDPETGENAKTLKILAIGGAAAEIVALADYISTQTAPPTRAEITLLDIGPWASIVHKLQTALTTAPPLSRYASAHARLANKALVAPSHLHSTFLQTDILSLAPSELAQLLAGPEGDDSSSTPILITLLFTLNELYTTSGTQRTTAFLRVLAARAAPGTLVLVVDSPGSYAEAAVGRDARRYPMQWLLEHTLLLEAPARRKASREDSNNNTTKNGKLEDRGPGQQEQRTSWEKVESHDSVWFRVAEGLRYPIPLENMRYQMHLYRARRADEGPGSPAT